MRAVASTPSMCGIDDVHEDDIGLQRIRVGDGLVTVGRIADDRELSQLMEHLSQRAPDRWVIVDDENLERIRGRTMAVGRRCRSPRARRPSARSRRGRCPAPRHAARRGGFAFLFRARCRCPCGLRAASAAHGCGIAPAHLDGFQSILQSGRLEPNPVIRHRDAQLIVGVELFQRQRDLIGCCACSDRVEEQLPDRLEEQRADILARLNLRADRRWIFPHSACTFRVSSSPATSGPAGSPERCSTGGNSSTFSDRATAIASSSCCFASASSSLCSSNVVLALQLLLEVQRHDDQKLLEPIVQRPRDLLARMVLGECQVPRHPTQLRGPVFQFGRALLKGHRGTLAFGAVGYEREGASAARRRERD